jgi:uncharacterized membrane protein
MEWTVLIAAHAIAALVALTIAPINMLRRRRDQTHRVLGRTWVASMLFVSVSSFWIVSDEGYNWLHGLAAINIVTVTLGLVNAMRRNIPAHYLNMIGSYLGLLVAFTFAITTPERAIPRLVITEPVTAAVVVSLVLLSVVALFAAVRLSPQTRRRAGTRPLR